MPPRIGDVAIPVFGSKRTSEGGSAARWNAALAFASSHRTDAHFAAYGAVKRAGASAAKAMRLGRNWWDAPERERRPVHMRLLVVDVDDETAHSLMKPARKTWRRREHDKLEALSDVAPGFTYYESKGGYRLVWPLERAAELHDREDAKAWADWYVAQLDWIEAVSGVKGDRACKDWTRLYRLPLVRRDGKDQHTPVVTAGKGFWPLHGRGLTAQDIGEQPDRDSAPTVTERAESTEWDASETQEYWNKDLARIVGESGAWDDGRQTWALAFFGWLARYLPEDELIDLVYALEEYNPERTEKYLSMVDRVEVLDGPSREVRDALGEAFAKVDRHVSTHPNAEAHPERVEEALAASRERVKARARKRAKATRKRAREERAAEHGTDLEVPEADPPAMVNIAGRAFVGIPGDERPYRGRMLPCYSQRYSESDAIQKLCEDANMVTSLGLENEKGQLKSDREIKRAASQLAERVERDFSAPCNVYDPDSRVMVEGFALPEIAPVRDARVEHWLDLLLGASSPDALRWIAGCAQRYIHRPGAALVLVGPKDVGKSIFFACIARLWGRPSFVALKHAIAQFNGAIASCPIIVDDECVAQHAGRDGISTTEFREIVQEREGRLVEFKGQEKILVRGALRLGITANDLADLRLSGARGPEAVAAVAGRLCMVHVPKRSHGACVAALDALRDANGELDMAAIVAHFAWIQATAADIPATERFIGAGGNQDTVTQIVTATSVDANPEVFEVLQQYLETEPPPGERPPREGAALVVHKGRLLCHPRYLADRTNVEPREIRRALQPFTLSGAGGKLFRFGNVVQRYWVLDSDAIGAALALDPERVARRMNA